MNGAPSIGDIDAIRGNYDTSNPVIVEILRAKEQRLKILQQLNKQYQEELDSAGIMLKENVKGGNKAAVKKRKKSEPNLTHNSIRRSARLQNSPTIMFKEDEEGKPELMKSQIVRPPNGYGPVPGVEVGTWWETRMECSLYGVHRPTVAGIHGGPDGAYSIALSGGYPEDVDEGDSFIYTGAGGRDLKGTATRPKNLRIAPQTKDQQLEGTNLSLVKSIKSKLPIRVIRGYKSPSIFAPESGYRYDGLYQVVKYWEDVGKAGYRIYRFKMQRITEQAPPPWDRDHHMTAWRKKVIDGDDVLTSQVSLGPECKENVSPTQNSTSFVVHSKEVKDVDNEIQMCINFFLKASVTGCEFKKDAKEEDFLGWDIK